MSEDWRPSDLVSKELQETVSLAHQTVNGWTVYSHWVETLFPWMKPTCGETTSLTLTVIDGLLMMMMMLCSFKVLIKYHWDAQTSCIYLCSGNMKSPWRETQVIKCLFKVLRSPSVAVTKVHHLKNRVKILKEQFSFFLYEELTTRTVWLRLWRGERNRYIINQIKTHKTTSSWSRVVKLHPTWP